MTAIYHSVLLLLLLLIALATIMITFAQPVREDASEGESTCTEKCISDLLELKKDSIFDLHHIDATNYGVLLM